MPDWEFIVVSKRCLILGVREVPGMSVLAADETQMDDLVFKLFFLKL